MSFQPAPCNDNSPPILPRRCFGAIVTTSAVSAALPPPTIMALLQRHMANDWGDLDPHDRAMNAEAVEACDGSRIMSSYTVPLDDGEQTVWIISYLRNDEQTSDPDYCNTCVLFPSDY